MNSIFIFWFDPRETTSTIIITTTLQHLGPRRSPSLRSQWTAWDSRLLLTKELFFPPALAACRWSNGRAGDSCVPLFFPPKKSRVFFVPHTHSGLAFVTSRITKIRNAFSGWITSQRFLGEIGANIAMEVYLFPQHRELKESIQIKLLVGRLGEASKRFMERGATLRSYLGRATSAVQCSGRVCSCFFFPVPLLACVQLIIFFSPLCAQDCCASSWRCVLAKKKNTGWNERDSAWWERL